ncbi:MAG: molybdopterin dinucleotide binding domain-containing protein, partial [Pseudomonadota bacterium]
GWWKTPRQEKATVMMEAFRADPKENRLWTSSGKIEVYSERVAAFGYDDAPGHPVWREPVEWLGNAAEGELHLISNQPERKLHSQLDQGDWCAGGKLHEREPVAIHPNDAAARGIADGDLVRLFNDRGACLGAALVTDDLRPGVIRMSTGAWWDPDETGMCRHGNPNAVTRDVGTSRLGQGPTAHSCLVQLEKYEGEAPPVRAFEPPEVRKEQLGT